MKCHAQQQDITGIGIQINDKAKGMPSQGEIKELTSRSLPYFKSQ